MLLLWALPLGLSIGAVSGFFGVGGGFLLTPILLLLGYSPATAITISLLYSMSTSISGSLKYIQSKRILWKVTLFLSISGMIGTQVAKPLVLYLEESKIDGPVISILYIVLLAYFSISMLSKGQTIDEENVSISVSPLRTILIGLLGGFISSTLGVGGRFCHGTTINSCTTSSATTCSGYIFNFHLLHCIDRFLLIYSNGYHSDHPCHSLSDWSDHWS